MTWIKSRVANVSQRQSLFFAVNKLSVQNLGQELTKKIDKSEIAPIRHKSTVNNVDAGIFNKNRKSKASVLHNDERPRIQIRKKRK